MLNELIDNMNYYIYILECVNHTYYTGYTTDIHRRCREHLAGSSKCKYTRSFPPIRLVACWEIYSTLSAVLKVEKTIKRLDRGNKDALLADPNYLRHLLSARDDLMSSIETLRYCENVVTQYQLM